MKTLLLTIACLMSAAAKAETKSDSIIINVGAKKKVIIYGETKADLKELEKIDLNKALKEMNKGLSEMPIQTKKMVVKDYDGSYKSDTPRVNLTAWNRFVKKTNINVHVAYLDMGYYQITPIGRPTTFIPETFGDYNKSLNLGVSVMHGKIFKLNNHVGFSLKKGIQYNFYQTKSVPIPMTYTRVTNDFNANGFSIFPSSLITTEYPITVENKYSDSKKNSIITTNIFKDGKKTIMQTLPTVHTFGYLSAELQPTFYLLNKKGKNTISISPGVFGSIKLHQIEKTKYVVLLNEIDKNHVGGSSSTNSNQDFGNFNAGINLEASYKIFHFFWRHNLYSSLGRAVGSSGDKLDRYNWTPVDGKGRIRITTFGLRIGR